MDALIPKASDSPRRTGRRSARRCTFRDRWWTPAVLIVSFVAAPAPRLVQGGDTPPSITGPELIASPEPGWAQWRGPRRDAICDETGLLPSWPESGPPLLWKTNGAGQGYSAPILSNGRMFLAGEFDEDLRILALDLQGRKLWTATHGQSWKGPYPGARASCTLSEGYLYHMNAHGRVACFDADTGREVWSFNMFERFGGKNITWATSENLLVDGPRLILTPGGSRALMAAVDKRTGATVWMTEPLRLGQSSNPAQQRLSQPEGAIDSCSYSSPILFSFHGRRQIVNCSLRHVFGVDADTGKLLWTQPYPTQYSVIATTPVIVGNGVFITAPDTKQGGKWFRIPPEPESGVDVGWTTPLDTCHGGLVHLEGTLFGSWYRKRRGWAAVDAATGAVRYEITGLDQGPVLYADQRLYCVSQEGEAVLLKPGPDQFAVAGRFRLVPGRKSDAWTHPVIYQGRLYLRYHDTLFCFDVRAR